MHLVPELGEPLLVQLAPGASATWCYPIYIDEETREVDIGWVP